MTEKLEEHEEPHLCHITINANHTCATLLHATKVRRIKTSHTIHINIYNIIIQNHPTYSVWICHLILAHSCFVWDRRPHPQTSTKLACTGLLCGDILRGKHIRPGTRWYPGTALVYLRIEYDRVIYLSTLNWWGWIFSLSGDTFCGSTYWHFAIPQRHFEHQVTSL